MNRRRPGFLKVAVPAFAVALAAGMALGVRGDAKRGEREAVGAWAAEVTKRGLINYVECRCLIPVLDDTPLAPVLGGEWHVTVAVARDRDAEWVADAPPCPAQLTVLALEGLSPLAEADLRDRFGAVVQ